VDNLVGNFIHRARGNQWRFPLLLDILEQRKNNESKFSSDWFPKHSR